jgi:hypothetical protein
MIKSVPSRGSVGSAFHLETWIGKADPTLPRDGTDLITRELTSLFYLAPNNIRHVKFLLF